MDLSSSIAAHKIATLELRGLAALASTGITQLRIPLQALVLDRGVALQVTAAPPTANSAVVYGRDDDAVMHNESPETQYLLQIACDALNVRSYAAAGSTVTGSSRLQARIGSDHHIYITNARFLFPVMPASYARNTHLCLRPEAVRWFPKPLCPDVFSDLLTEDADTRGNEVKDCLRWLLEKLAPSCAAQLSAKSYVGTVACSVIAQTMHQFGINLHFLGQVRSHVVVRKMRNLLLVEMLARVFAHLLRAEQRACLDRQANGSGEHIEEVIRKQLNALLGFDSTAMPILHKSLRELMVVHFPGCLTAEERSSPNIIDGLPTVQLAERAAQLAGATLSGEALAAVGRDNPIPTGSLILMTIVRTMALPEFAEASLFDERLAEAEAIYMKEIELKQKLLGDNALSLIHTHSRLAAVLSRMKFHERAEKSQRRAVHIATRKHGDIGTCQRRLGDVYLESGQFDKAATALQKAIMLHRHVFDESHPAVSDALLLLAQAQHSLQQDVAAVDQQLMQALRSQHRLDSYDAARVYLRQGAHASPATAVPLLRHAHSIQKRLLQSRDSELLSTSAALGVALAQENDSTGDEAYELLESVLSVCDTLVAKGEQAPFDIGPTLVQLAALCQRAGDTEKAQMYSARAEQHRQRRPVVPVLRIPETTIAPQPSSVSSRTLTVPRMSPRTNSSVSPGPEAGGISPRMQPPSFLQSSPTTSVTSRSARQDTAALPVLSPRGGKRSNSPSFESTPSLSVHDSSLSRTQSHSPQREVIAPRSSRGGRRLDDVGVAIPDQPIKSPRQQQQETGGDPVAQKQQTFARDLAAANEAFAAQEKIQAAMIYVSLLRSIAEGVAVQETVHTQILFNLGALYSSSKRADEALDSYRALLALLAKQPPERQDTEMYIHVHIQVARLLDIQKHHVDAAEYFKKAISLCTTAAAGKRLAEAYMFLGQNYMLQSKLKKAKPMFKRALAQAEKSFGAISEEVARIQTALGNAYVQDERYPEAQDIYSRALSVRTKLHGTNHDTVADLYNKLAEIYTNNDMAESAKQLYDMSLSIRSKLHGDGSAQAVAQRKLMSTVP
eukprot:TRINITY_DN11555_c0_g1_i1.p1 TRINITY_DN11555_c0_g1~~TRINITY_DN11555_c0_g1_i1.p1  ORF type:complete len:1213 (-),score=274.33 TRINITY_DN11555_c0_g1_i1:32-3238(-)